MYSTYQRNFSINSECEADPSSRKKIIILGGGVVGENAAVIATGMQAKVHIVDKSEDPRTPYLKALTM